MATDRHTDTQTNASKNIFPRFRGRMKSLWNRRWHLYDDLRCRDHDANALVVSLSGCYGDDEAILMWKLREGDVSEW